jgi:serine/threonine protein kinase/dipeptidyl aminopeptidase/acylaminoacyl peptidase
MGQVYLALDNRLGRYAALKFLPAQLAADDAMLHRLQQEARAASALNHPNIVTIYEVAEAGGEYFIASEYIEGQTLRSLLANGALESSRAIEIATQIAAALTAAHAAGIVHRDLKPGNVMIRPDGYVKVIDFGLAKAVKSRGDGTRLESWTREGCAVGTVEYMSPEQARGEGVDARTDLWSLGIILYEMLAGKRPFDGPTESHVMVAILDHPAPALPNSSADKVLRRALVKNRSKRYQAAPELLADLKLLNRTATWRAEHVRFSAQGKRPHYAPRHVALAAILLLLIALTVWWARFGGHQLVLAPDWLQLGSPARLTFEGNVQSATLSSDGKYLAYVAGPDGGESLHIRQISTGSETESSRLPSPCIGITFSPGNNSVFYVLKDRHDELGRLYRMGLTSTVPRLILENIDGPVTFSPDGRQFAYLLRREEKTRATDSIMLAALANPRNAKPVVTLTGTEIQGSMAWSPKGDSIAAVVFPEQLDIKQPDKATVPVVSLYSLKGELKRQFTPVGLRKLRSPVWIDNSMLVFSGLPQGSEQMRLEQLSTGTGRFHEVPSGVLGLDSVSATPNGALLTAVRSEHPSSIWIAGIDKWNAPERVTPDTENISSFAWAENGDLILPSARGGNVNLWRLDQRGDLQQVGTPEPCVQREPLLIPHTSSLVYSANCASGGDDFNLWRVDLNTGKRTQLTSGANYDFAPSVSPDGQWIVFTSYPSNIVSVWKLPVTGGIPTRLTSMQARFPSVSPDGTRVLCEIRPVDGDWRVAILSLDDGTTLKEFPRLPVANPLHWSPDGQAIDYLDASHRIVRQPLNGQPPRELLRIGEGSIGFFAWNQTGTKLAFIRTRAEDDVVLFRRWSRR